MENFIKVRTNRDTFNNYAFKKTLDHLGEFTVMGSVKIGDVMGVYTIWKDSDFIEYLFHKIEFNTIKDEYDFEIIEE